MCSQENIGIESILVPCTQDTMAQTFTHNANSQAMVLVSLNEDITNAPLVSQVLLSMFFYCRRVFLGCSLLDVSGGIPSGQTKRRITVASCDTLMMKAKETRQVESYREIHIYDHRTFKYKRCLFQNKTRSVKLNGAAPIRNLDYELKILLLSWFLWESLRRGRSANAELDGNNGTAKTS